MKKTLITSIIATPIITLGVLTAVNATQTELQSVKENAAVVKAQEVVEPKEVTRTNSPITSPEATQETLAPETSIVSTEDIGASTQPTVSEYDMTWGLVFHKINSYTFTNQFLKGKQQLITSAVMAKYETNPELFTNIDATVSKCIAFYEAINPGNDRAKQSITLMNLTKRECGL